MHASATAGPIASPIRPIIFAAATFRNGYDAPHTSVALAMKISQGRFVLRR
ncbi:hypothetical protein AGRO_3366 [Agrobacterium sp. ATCC 31749]|jgi:hypothetical protein|nr:hypothetical protein AGRO_3366 [Agrobacterium sp. ATCC 31749]KJX86140.1 hypothetical protein SY94_4061 [Agrobacterium tumefaciens]